jgi:hypothetical protein
MEVMVQIDVWLQLLGRGETGAVGVHVDGAHAASFIVGAEAAEKLARLLLSADVLDAAREVVRRYTSNNGIGGVVDAVDWLAQMVAIAERHGPTAGAPPTPGAPDTGPPTRYGEATHLLDAAMRLAYYGHPEAMDGFSPFRAVAMAGVATTTAGDPLPFAAINGGRDDGAQPSWRALSKQLRSLADHIDGHVASRRQKAVSA